MNTITTIYRGPTARRGARIEARIEDGASTVCTYPYQHELSVAGNHERAALQFARHCGCVDTLVGGSTLAGGIWHWVPLVDGVTRTVDPARGACAWPPAGASEVIVPAVEPSRQESAGVCQATCRHEWHECDFAGCTHWCQRCLLPGRAEVTR